MTTDEHLVYARLRRLQQLEAAVKKSDADLQLEWKRDPVGWVKKALGEHFWSKQREIAESVRDNRRTVVQACHGIGKSFALSRLICWWLSVHPVGEAFVISTAPTFPQVRAILWREINIACAKAHLVRDTPMSEIEWKINGQIVGFGRKPSDYDPTNFQGYHAKYVLVVLDEACGVPVSLWDAADTLITGSDCRIVAIGNPDDPASEFAKACSPGSGWNRIQISAFSSPNFTGEEIPDEVRPLLTSPDWVEEKRKKWRPGQHPFWDSKVMGEFPEMAEDSLISMGALRRANMRWAEDFPNEKEPRILACDVARFGTDETVIGLRFGRRFQVVRHYGHLDTMTTTGNIVRARRELSTDSIVVDADGVGGGVVDRLLELHQPVTPIHNGSRSRSPEEFLNRRAEYYWNLRELLNRDQVELDPEDEDLASQLLSLKWKNTSRGQIQIESKDDLRSRGMDSPDRADCCMLGFSPQQIDFDRLYDIYWCRNCGHGYVVNDSAPERPCPRCGTKAVQGEEMMADAT